MATIEEIEEILEKVKCYINKGKVDFIERKDKYALGKLGISFDDAFAIVSELTYKNYYKGPTPDHKFP